MIPLFAPRSWYQHFVINNNSSTNCQAPLQTAYFLWSCDKVYHKQEVCFLLYFLSQIVSWQYNPNLLDKNWPCTVIHDHDWQLWTCPLPISWQVGVSGSHWSESWQTLLAFPSSMNPVSHAKLTSAPYCVPFVTDTVPLCGDIGWPQST